MQAVRSCPILVVVLLAAAPPTGEFFASACSEVYWILGRADSLLDQQQYEPALEEYRDSLEKHSDPFVRQAALVGAGRCQRELGRLEEAIRSFKDALGVESGGCEPGQSVSIYHQQSQWDLARALLQKKDYASALEAFGAYRAIPKHITCGLGDSQEAYTNDVYEGICREGLGDYKGAVTAYFRAADTLFKGAAGRRLARLYLAAGQTRDLEGILREQDRRTAAEMAAFRARSGTPPSPDDAESPVSRQIRNILKIHELGRTGDWATLVDLVECPRPEVRPPSALPCDFLEASEVLARRPGRAVPLLAERLATAAGRSGGPLLHALGRCATPEAAALLRQHALREKNSWALLDIAHGLDLCGPPGDAVLAALWEGSTENLHGVISLHRKGRLQEAWSRSHNLEDLPFPAIPRRIVLPSGL